MNLAYVAANKWWIPAQFRLVGAKDAVLAPGQPKRRFDFLALKRIPWFVPSSVALHASDRR